MSTPFYTEFIDRWMTVQQRLKPPGASSCLEPSGKMLFRKAFQIATEVHSGQFDKGSAPYLFHVVRVSMAGTTINAQVVGLLHDVIEDGGLTWRGTIESLFPYEIVYALLALTHFKAEPYLDYLKRVQTSPLAVAVKLNDIRDNMDEARLGKLHPEQAERLRAKYAAAYAFLTAKSPESPLPSPSE